MFHLLQRSFVLGLSASDYVFWGVVGLTIAIWAAMVCLNKQTADLANKINVKQRWLDLYLGRRCERGPFKSHSLVMVGQYYFLLIWLAMCTQDQWLDNSARWQLLTAPIVLMMGASLLGMTCFCLYLSRTERQESTDLFKIQAVTAIVAAAMGTLWTRHFTFLVVLFLFALAFFADWFCGYLMQRLRETKNAPKDDEEQAADPNAAAFHLANLKTREICRTDLFLGSSKLKGPINRLLFAISTFAVLAPWLFMLLFPPACFLLFLSGGAEVDAWAIVILVLTIIFAALSQLYPRLGHSWAIYRQSFFQGGPAVVSTLIIGLGLADYFQISYVRMFVDAVPQMATGWFVALYVAFWIYEYWLNRHLGERVLALLDGKTGRATTLVYDLDNSKEIFAHGIARKNRQIDVHGGGRFVALGWKHVSPTDKVQRFEFYSLNALLERILGRGKGEGNEDQLLLALRLVQRTYYSTMSSLLLASFLILVVFAYNSPREPVANVGEIALAQPLPMSQTVNNPASAAAKAGAENPAAEQLAQLDHLLFKSVPEGRDGKPPRVILLAASGGGTRASMFTSSVLSGLHDINALNDVRLISGVSGGGYSLAYYYAHLDKLKNAKRVNKRWAAVDLSNTGFFKGPQHVAGEWQDFHRAATHNYIAEVLLKCTEIRLLQGTPMGRFLAESFDDKIHQSLAENQATLNEGDRVKVVGRTDIGLILNSTITGSTRPLPTKSAPATTRALNPNELRNVKNAHTFYAGSRIVWTNLAGEYFRDAPGPFANWAIFVADSRQLTVGRAAALNANFPPVFQNAGVQGTNELHWVTDGGSTDNRGAITLLTALHQYIRSIDANAKDKEKFPDIYLLIAEATGVSIDYSHNWGVSTTMFAQYPVASRLISSMHHEVNAAYFKKTNRKVHLQYLQMPSVLRMRGGVGTHWMWPQQASIEKVYDDAHRVGHSGKQISLSGNELRQLFFDLHSEWWRKNGATMPPNLTRNQQAAWELVNDDRVSEHQEHWNELRAALSRP